MAFGQHPGPPAHGRQIQQLTELLHAAGHTDFRDARGPLGLTQRQAGGKFTRDEADELIARLEAEATSPDASGTADAASAEAPGAVPSARAASPRAPSVAARRREADLARSLRTAPADLLAAELQRRGWVVLEP